MSFEQHMLTLEEDMMVPFITNPKGLADFEACLTDSPKLAEEFAFAETFSQVVDDTASSTKPQRDPLGLVGTYKALKKARKGGSAFEIAECRRVLVESFTRYMHELYNIGHLYILPKLYTIMIHKRGNQGMYADYNARSFQMDRTEVSVSLNV